MRSRLLLVFLLLLTTACAETDKNAAKPDSNSKTAAAKAEPNPAEIAAAKKEAEEAAKLAEEARVEAETVAAAKRLVEATEKFAALNEDLETETKAYSAARRKVKSQEEAMELAKKNPMAILGPKFIEFAKTYAGTEEAFEAITMLAVTGSGETKTEAVELMIKDHVDDDSMLNLVSTMTQGMPTPQNAKWIDQIIENTSIPKIEGNALVAKAGLLNNVTTFKGILAAASAKQLATVEKEVLDYVNAERDANELKELEGLMEAFVKENSTEANIVERELFALKYLGINCVAPDILGRDLDDKEFKLSDYRGKVVFLDFWGDW